MRIQILFVLTATLHFLSAGSPPLLQGENVKGTRYPETVVVAEKTLRLLGAGLREKWFFDVYTMGAYSESGSCSARDIISADEIKSLRLHLLRGVRSEAMANALGDALAKNTPPDASQDLRGRISIFLSYFREDLAKGSDVELTYLPGVGVRLRQNGRQQGAVTPGKDFADILWSCYFGSKTCCTGLKKQILSGCSRRR